MTIKEAIIELEDFLNSPIGDGDLHMESVEVALDALCEQAEREKGCLYCAGYEAEFMLPIIEMDENTAQSLDVDGNFAYIHCHCGRHTVGEINYCPNCGKKLKEV